MDMQSYYLGVAYVLAAVFGLCVGSFLNVVIYRVPAGLSLATPSSHCPKCKYVLRCMKRRRSMSFWRGSPRD